MKIIVVDGIEWVMEVWCDGDCISVKNGNTRITAEFDHQVEQLFWESYEEDTDEEQQGTLSFFEFISQEREQLARNLIVQLN